MNKLTTAIPCSECEYAIYVPHDPFTGKPRYHCGQGLEVVGEFGDAELMSDRWGGCELGKRKEKSNMEEIVYFELNNWFCGRDYPDAEPFISWLNDDSKQKLTDDAWAKENKLCIVACPYDMSLNYCITATKDWVLQNCPDLLSDKTYDSTFIVGVSGDTQEIVKQYSFKKFLKFPDKYGEVWGRVQFLEYKEENFGVHWVDDPMLEPDPDDEDEE